MSKIEGGKEKQTERKRKNRQIDQPKKQKTNRQTKCFSSQSVMGRYNYWKEQYITVCQIRVTTEFGTTTLTQDGAVDFKTITVFLFPKLNRQLFFSRDQNIMQCLHSRSPRNKSMNQKRPFYYFIEFDRINPDTFLRSFKEDSNIIM